MKIIDIRSPAWPTQYLIGGSILAAGLQSLLAAAVKMMWLCVLQFADTIFYDWTLAFLIKSPW